MEEAIYIPKRAVRKKRVKGMIDAIYWRLHSAFLRNQREKAKHMLLMLADSGTEEEIEAEIGPIHMDRFRQIKWRIDSSIYGRIYGEGYETPIVDPVFAPIEKSGDELEYCKTLSMNYRQELFKLLNITPTSLVEREADMREFGRCDFVIRDKRIVHLIEVKMGKAPSSVVSQIDKYRLGVELDMCLGLYDIVTATVMAEHFPPYVATELSRLSVKMVVHNGKNDFKLLT